jgi:hypothetical protein
VQVKVNRRPVSNRPGQLLNLLFKTLAKQLASTIDEEIVKRYQRAFETKKSNTHHHEIE